MIKGVAKFNRTFFDPDHSITFIGSGSLGGKAQGLVSISNTLSQYIPTDDTATIRVKVPRFAVICTDIFKHFMKRNNLYDIAYSDKPDERIAHAFQLAELPFEVLGDLRALSNEVKIPLAIRSSSKLEDAKYEPFAGIYATKMTPNNQLDPDARFRRLVEAIKFVYASTYFKAAKDYMAATNNNIEDEEMAVIIQELLGRRHGDRYYPELSGVARSYNFYAMGRAKPNQGVVNLALGLGKTIVDGGVSWSYTPPFPKISPPFGSIGDMLKNTQNEFWAVNMGKAPAYDPINEAEYLDIENLTTADRDKTLKYLASTLDRQSGRLTIGTGPDGPRVLTFAPILLLNEIPLNELIKKLITVCEQAYDSPVEIEFAVTFHQQKKCRFGFLQVRPMVVSKEEVKIEAEELVSKEIFTATESALGNGIITNISDIIYVRPDIFDAKNTPQIARELEELNKGMLQSGRPYLLVGFGRWGSSDPWLGIPVNWGQISGAKAIVEATLENMNVELSQGSHFFHNLTSFNVPYFSVPFSGKYKIDWPWLDKQKLLNELQFTRHIGLPQPLKIKVDGCSGRGVIYKT